MSTLNPTSPALEAAQLAEHKMLDCLAENRSFLLEAGAGAGKTHSLVAALKFLIEKRGRLLKRTGQRIACITYTNAATAVIRDRIDGNAAVYTDTIHAFSWSILKAFQSALRSEITKLTAWQERIKDAPLIHRQVVEYDLGYRKISEESIGLHHDDVLSLMSALLRQNKFRLMVAQRYPYILIDEYQDTHAEMMTALQAAYFDAPASLSLGFFGDHWQRIYDKTCGHVAHDKLEEIGKGANFRSATNIVDVLNQMRPALPQAPRDLDFKGSAEVFHTNTWVGERRTGAGGGHWTGDLPSQAAHSHLAALIETLEARGWTMSPEHTKILMLTHNVLAEEQGYRNLLNIFPYSDSLFKKDDEIIAFFADRVEPACKAFQAKRYGEMFVCFGEAAPRMESYGHKALLSKSMSALVELRLSGTIGSMLDLLEAQAFPRLPESVLKRSKFAREFVAEPGTEEVPDQVDLFRKMREIPYREVMALVDFIEGHTPFATKHSVKGDEFKNVLVVIGRGWNRYNFDQFLAWAGAPESIPPDRQDAFERNRNLFYVACSRPTTNLALLFTQKLSLDSLETLRRWFGRSHVTDISMS